MRDANPISRQRDVRVKRQAFARSLHSGPRARQRGFSLIVALLMLIVIIILGVGASQMSINEERGARSDRDKQIAFQAAEAALKDAEYEILYSPTPCGAGATEPGRGRPPSAWPAGQYTCFNEVNSFGYAPSCSVPPNNGLCDYNAANPVWADASPGHIDFYTDATCSTPNGCNARTVMYGAFSGKTYGSQSSMPGLALSKYPPRYIIELVPKNVSVDSKAAERHMFRVTAMGFGANANTQVVLQTIVSTKE